MTIGSITQRTSPLPWDDASEALPIAKPSTPVEHGTSLAKAGPIQKHPRQSVGKTQLEKPDPIHSDQPEHTRKELDALFAQIDEKTLETMIFSLFLNQKKIHEDCNQRRAEEMNKRAEQQEEMSKAINEKLKDMVNMDLLAWANTILNGITVGTAIASFAVASFLAGTPLVLVTTANAVLTVGNGTITLTKGYFDYKNGCTSAEIDTMKMEREKERKQTGEIANHVREDMQAVVDLLQQLRQILESQQEVAHSIMR